MDICIYCLRERGHTEHCESLKDKARHSNLTFAIQYHCMRATISNYKQQVGERDKNLIGMWKESTDSWCEGIGRLIQGAVDRGQIKEVYMLEA